MKTFWWTLGAVVAGLFVAFLVKELFPGLVRKVSGIIPPLVS